MAVICFSKSLLICFVCSPPRDGVTKPDSGFFSYPNWAALASSTAELSSSSVDIIRRLYLSANRTAIWLFPAKLFPQMTKRSGNKAMGGGAGGSGNGSARTRASITNSPTIYLGSAVRIRILGLFAFTSAISFFSSSKSLLSSSTTVTEGFSNCALLALRPFLLSFPFRPFLLLLPDKDFLEDLWSSASSSSLGGSGIFTVASSWA
mmetsp:Transcript_25970/g.34072  ORF Transcript_25970/g.34072 Transcript_25970/m.34072 type:complete len:206 (+) Transcript_25970:2699-3316(+)